MFTVLSLRKSRAQCAYKRMQIIALGENTHWVKREEHCTVQPYADHTMPSCTQVPVLLKEQKAAEQAMLARALTVTATIERIAWRLHTSLSLTVCDQISDRPTGSLVHSNMDQDEAPRNAKLFFFFVDRENQNIFKQKNKQKNADWMSNGLNFIQIRGLNANVVVVDVLALSLFKLNCYFHPRADM